MSHDIYIWHNQEDCFNFMVKKCNYDTTARSWKGDRSAINVAANPGVSPCLQLHAWHISSMIYISAMHEHKFLFLVHHLVIILGEFRF